MTLKVPMVTIITDASHMPSCRLGSWGGVAICNGQRFRSVGIIKSLVATSNEAELAAIVNMVHLVVGNDAVPEGAGWLIQTDNMHIVHCLSAKFNDRRLKGTMRKLPKTTPYIAQGLKLLAEMEDKAKPEFIHTKHVKGHMAYNNREKRHHVQQTVDEVVRQRLREHMAALTREANLEVSCPHCKAAVGRQCFIPNDNAGKFPYRPEQPRSPHTSRMEKAITLLHERGVDIFKGET